MSISQQELDELVRLVREYKEAIVATNKGPIDIIPQVDLMFEGGRRFLGQANSDLFAMTEMGTPLFDLIGAGVRMKWAKIGRPRLMALRLIVEGYQVAVDTPGYERGDMERDFRTNPDSKVVEMVGLYTAYGDGEGGAEVSMVDMGFAYTDGGVVRWDEPHYVPPTDMVEGLLVEMFRQLFADIGRRRG